MSRTDGPAVLALDVDGVIAVDEPASTPTFDGSVSAWGRWRREIRVPVDAPATIARLAEHFEIVWVSAWGHNAHTALASVLGLPKEPWTFLAVQFGKPAAVARYAARRPWILIEDRVSGTMDFDERVIQVDPTRGIADVDPATLIEAASASVPSPSIALRPDQS